MSTFIKIRSSGRRDWRRHHLHRAAYRRVPEAVRAVHHGGTPPEGGHRGIREGKEEGARCAGELRKKKIMFQGYYYRSTVPGWDLVAATPILGVLNLVYTLQSLIII